MAILRLMAKLLLIISVIIIGSKPMYNENFAIVQGNITTPEANSDYINSTIRINYPEGYTVDNCVIISLMINSLWRVDTNWNTTGGTGTSREIGAYGLQAILTPTDIAVSLSKVDKAESSKTGIVRVILMKLPNGTDATLLGDANNDGEVDSNDLEKIRDYIMGQTSLTFDQFANADMNKDGEVKSADYAMLKNILGIE